jgi:hypothetical protein
MKNKLIMVVMMVLVVCLPALGAATEKQVNIKGLTIGMPADEARTILTRHLTGDWKLTVIGPVDEVLAGLQLDNRNIFGNRVVRQDLGYKNTYVEGIIGDYGFAVSRHNSCEGFISLHKETRAVIRISLGGAITEALYNPDKKKVIDMEVFVPDFSRHFGLPDFSWIPYGWQYESPNGYTIVFKTDKLIDIKMNEKLKPPPDQAEGNADKKLKFE